MIFSPDHIVVGYAIHGIVIDTTLIWKKIYAFGDSLNMYIHPGIAIYRMVVEIQNDTLVINDYMADGFKHYNSR